MLDNRSKIIEAAARIYAAHGYRGATTRRIAEEAGVNEVTLFRQFGSKSALLDAMVESCLDLQLVALPVHPVDPEAELTLWVAAHMTDIAAKRDLLRQVMREFAEHPDHATCAGKGPAVAAEQLRDYVIQLRRAGWLDTDPRTEATAPEVGSAVTMLMAAFFVDGMDREMMPRLFATPVDEAPRAYVRVFLRGIGLRSTPNPPSDSAPYRPHPRTVQPVASNSSTL
jgi:AcrR family transcriptional regulator